MVKKPSPCKADLLEELEYQAQYPHVLVHVEKEGGAFSLTAHETKEEALKKGRYPHHHLPMLMSWDDYFEWKQLRTSNPTT